MTQQEQVSHEVREAIYDLDAWLAAQEAAGVRFGWCALIENGVPHCALGRYAADRGVSADVLAAADDGNEPYHVALPQLLPLPATALEVVVWANDHSSNCGNPKIVRARLHETYPFLSETPVSPEVSHAV